MDARDSFSFSDFPEDIQLSILSFLSPKEIASFACTSKRFVLLCRSDDKLWYAMCERRWGSKTQIKKWGDGKIAYKLLYKILNEWENLIGFWRRSGQPMVNVSPSSPPLIFFEWGPSFLAGSRICPSQNGTYDVVKFPFLWMSLSPDGGVLNFLQLNGEIKLWGDVVKCCELGVDEDLVSVNVSFIGFSHVLVEENYSNYYREQGNRRSPSVVDLNARVEDGEGTSGECLVTEMYMQFANRISPGAGGDRALRRQRRRERERQGKRRWEPEHFVKIGNCSPTPARPLQGLWKGIRGGFNLDFYLVGYDRGGIICRRVGDLSSCSAAPVFWTSNTTFIESPFSPEEEYLYDSQIHHPSLAEGNHMLKCDSTDNEVVSHIMYINSSYDLVIRDSAGTSANPQQGEGRIWRYQNGTFGFGFFWDNFITDLKHMVQDGHLLDAVEV